MNRRTRTLAVTSALVAVAGAGAGGAATYAALAPEGTTTIVRQVAAGSAQPAASTSSLTVNDVYRRAHASVVEITVTGQSSASPFGGAQTQQAQGSGFVYDRDGHIVTNEHVVDGATSVSVRFSNGASYDAEVVGTDASTDLAVLKVDAPSSLLQPLALADSGDLEVGDGVVAIGSPFGLEETVTTGIVSALHRQMTSPNGFTINDSIQTDAAINHGNSGGPLLSLQGEVVGVNAQIRSDSGGSDGIGFAIPSSTVRSVVSQLVETGKAQHGYLGVGIETTSGSVRLSQIRPSTPAATAGLRAGDVITAVDGDRVASAAELQSAIDAKRPGDTIELTYSRAGKSHTVQVQLADRPS
jgi:putative serine protease PepD